MAKWLRLLGLALFVFLLAKLDITNLLHTLRGAAPGLLVAAVLLNLPMWFLKVLRWQITLAAQDIHYPFAAAAPAYIGSIYIGLVTPGRLGEFVKAAHLVNDCAVSTGLALSSVLADRLFDLGALLAVGGAALLALGTGSIPALLAMAALAAAGLAAFLDPRAFGLMRRAAMRLGKPGRWLFAPGGWLEEMRAGMRALRAPVLALALALTALAYLVFFVQCYLLALALALPLNLVTVAYTVALGSLVSLLPVSISGLGTRDAAIIAYLGTAGTAPEHALAFSLLVFAVFNLTGGLAGAAAWWAKPVDWRAGE